MISLLAKLSTLAWEFHKITRFGNIETVINREKYLNVLWRILITEGGKLLQGYMNGNKSSKEDSRQDEKYHRNGCKRIIQRDKLVFNLRRVKEEDNRKREELVQKLWLKSCVDCNYGMVIMVVKDGLYVFNIFKKIYTKILHGL